MAQQQFPEHLTTEQLSAFLDGQLAPTEQALCDAHLRDCEQCRRALQGLRMTVSLLKALPQPAPPRSFTLPVGSFAVPEQPQVRVARPLPFIPASRRAAPASRWTLITRSTLRAVGTIAAVVGLVFLLSSLWTTLPAAQNGASRSSTTNSGDVAQPNTNSGTQRTPATRTGQSATNPETPPAKVPATAVVKSATPTSSQMGTRVAPLQPAPPLLDLGLPGTRLLFGLLLLLLSIVCILLARRRPTQRAQI